jgi:hypothetical protein
MSSSQKIYVKRDFAAGVYLSEAPESHTLFSYTLYACIYTVYLFTQGRGGGGRIVEPERRLEGQQFTKLGRKYKHD